MILTKENKLAALEADFSLAIDCASVDPITAGLVEAVAHLAPPFLKVVRGLVYASGNLSNTSDPVVKLIRQVWDAETFHNNTDGTQDTVSALVNPKLLKLITSGKAFDKFDFDKGHKYVAQKLGYVLLIDTCIKLGLDYVIDAYSITFTTVSGAEISVLLKNEELCNEDDFSFQVTPDLLASLADAVEPFTEAAPVAEGDCSYFVAQALLAWEDSFKHVITTNNGDKAKLVLVGDAELQKLEEKELEFQYLGQLASVTEE